MNLRRERAAQAEEAVAQALLRQDWRILARNFRHTGFELDIVAMKGRTLATVEVKYRRHFDFNVMETLLPRAKYAALKRGLLYFARHRPIRADILRIDLALVFEDGVTATPAIRYWPGITPEWLK